MKSKKGLILVCSIVSAFLAALIAVLIILNGIKINKDKILSSDTGTNISSFISAISTQSGDDITSSVTNEVSSEAIPVVSSSEVVVSSEPPIAPPAPQPTPPVYTSSVPPLTEEKIAYLNSLDNTKIGWGQGNSVNEIKRPLNAISSQETYGKYSTYYIMTESQNVYLTFDEGYENGYTPQILNTLRDNNVSAVFFVTLSYAKKNPDLVRRMINEGHIVGNHSTKHLSFPDMTIEDAYNDIKGLHDYIEQNFGYKMTLFRFPMGHSSERMQALLYEMGYSSLFWSFAYKDWETANQPDCAYAFNEITSKVHPGALYLLHAVSKTNTDILGQVIEKIRQDGYTISKFPTE